MVTMVIHAQGEVNMARQKKLKTAALNITTETPHSPRRYVELIEFLNENNELSGKIGGSDRLTLRQIYLPKGKAILGHFARYTHINPSSPWYDVSKRSPILGEDGKPIPQTKEGIGPNYKDIGFVFLPEAHLFVIDCRHVSPSRFKQGLDGILMANEVTSKFGLLSLTVLPTKDALKNLLKLQNMTKIELEFTLPNGDVSDDEDRIRRRYEEIRASKVQKKVTGHSRHGLEPSKYPELMAEMTIASANGYVRVTHTDSKGNSKTKSTTNSPRYETIKYKLEGYWDALGSMGEYFVSSGGANDPKDKA